MRFFKILILVVLVLAFLPSAGRAVGIDFGPVVAKLTEQLTQMSKDFKEYQKISTAAQEQIDAIGKAGRITVPIINATKIASQVRQDIQCLKPDFSKLMPNVEFEDAELGSLCKAGSAYRKTLWIDPEEFKKLTTWQSKDEMGRAIEKRRNNVLSDSAEKGLALADTASKEVQTTIAAAEELKNEADAAETENQRLAVIAKSQAVQVQVMARQNQLLAQLLRVQSAYAIKAGVPIEDFKAGEGDQAQGGGQ